MQMLLARTTHIDAIFIASRWTNMLGLQPISRVEARRLELWGMPAPDRTLEFAAALKVTLRQLATLGIPVVIVLSPPEFEIELPRCLSWRAQSACAVGRDRLVAFGAPAIDTIRRVVAEYPGVRVFDPLPLLCQATICPPIVDGAAVVFDDNHLSTTWARRLAPAITAAATKHTGPDAPNQ